MGHLTSGWAISRGFLEEVMSESDIKKEPAWRKLSNDVSDH